MPKMVMIMLVAVAMVHLLSLSLVEGAKEAGDEHVELPDLLLVVVLQRILVPLLQPSKRCTHLKIFSL